MEVRFTKYAVEQILEIVLKEEGADDKDLKAVRWQVVAYADDVVNGRMDICEACVELQNWYLAVM
jgi:hypothetical protein